jgi:hypothetical protein
METQDILHIEWKVPQTLGTYQMQKDDTRRCLPVATIHSSSFVSLGLAAAATVSATMTCDERLKVSKHLKWKFSQVNTHSFGQSLKLV